VAFLIFIPLVFAIVLDAAAIYSLIFPPGTLPYAATGGKIGLVVILTTLAATLAYLLIRTSRSPFLDVKGVEKADPAAKQRITGFVMSTVYATLFLIAIVVIRVQHFRFWIGAVSGLLGLLMLSSTVIHLRYIRHLPPNERTKSTTIQLARHIVIRNKKRLIGLYSVLALLLWPAFNLLNAERYISVFDLVGLLIFLSSMIFWVIVTGMAAEKKAVSSKIN
jgi:hypothetical protein